MTKTTDRFNILQELHKFKYLGEKKAENGTLLIGKAPHIAPLAWLHNIYPPLESSDIAKLEVELGVVIPGDYKQFLSVSNGLGVFNTTLSLYGSRTNYRRTIEDVWQPFDILVSNKLERPDNAGKTIFFIGSYDWDGSYLYIDSKTNKVHFCEREDSTSLYQWPNFDTMLQTEIPRLIMLFDEKGKEKDIDKSTLPIQTP